MTRDEDHSATGNGNGNGDENANEDEDETVSPGSRRDARYLLAEAPGGNTRRRLVAELEARGPSNATRLESNWGWVRSVLGSITECRIESETKSRAKAEHG